MKENNRENTEQVFGKNPTETGENLQAPAEMAGAGEQERKVVNGQITEEQVRLLLEQDKFETEQRMKGASTHSKKVLTLVIGAVIFLAVIGVVMWLVVGDKKAESGVETGKNGEVVASGVVDEDEKVDGGKSSWNADIYGYGVVCGDQTNGLETTACNVIELHKSSEDVVLASYRREEQLGDGAISDSGHVNGMYEIMGNLCWEHGLVRRSHEYPWPEGMDINVGTVVSCVDTRDNERVVHEKLRLEKPTMSEGEYVSVTFTGDAIYYRIGDYEEIEQEDYKRYNFATGEITDIEYSGAPILYGEKNNELYSYSINDGRSEYIVLDELLRAVEIFSGEEASTRYAAAAKITTAPELYLNGRLLKVNESRDKLLYDNKVVYERGYGDGMIEFAYSGAGDVFSKYASGEAVLFGVGNGCGGQTCQEVKTLEYDVKTGKITELEGMEFWQGNSRGWSFLPVKEVK